MSENYVWIRNWDRFQHYKDRDPTWIKNYRALLSSDEYLGLTMSERGVLHGIWLAYASSNRALRGHTASLTRRLGQRVTSEQLTSLNHAGFIQLLASKPLSDRYHDASPEKSREEKEQEPSVQPVARPPATWDGEEPDGLTGELEQSTNGLPDLEHLLKEIP